MTRPKLRKQPTGAAKKAQKEAKKRLAKQATSMLNHPTQCCLCAAAFTRTKETVKSWHVTVIEQRVRLTCPVCWDTISEAIGETANGI